MSALGEISREVARGLPGAQILPEGGIRFTRHGYSGRVEYSSAATEILFDLKGQVTHSLQIAPAGLWHDLKRLLGRQDYQVGERSFDDAFQIATSEAGFASRVLAPEIRALLRSAALEGNSLWRVSRAGFLLRIPRLPDRVSDLERWLGLGLQLLDALPGLLGVDEMQVGEVRVALDAEGSCLICGCPLKGAPVVRCTKCATPHHRDCWEFNGRCSTFACGGTRFR